MGAVGAFLLGTVPYGRSEQGSSDTRNVTCCSGQNRPATWRECGEPSNCSDVDQGDPVPHRSTWRGPRLLGEVDLRGARCVRLLPTQCPSQVNVETRRVLDYSRQLHCFAAPSNGSHWPRLQGVISHASREKNGKCLTAPTKSGRHDRIRVAGLTHRRTQPAPRRQPQAQVRTRTRPAPRRQPQAQPRTRRRTQPAWQLIKCQSACRRHWPPRVVVGRPE
jgi:hypothetical protein